MATSVREELDRLDTEGLRKPHFFHNEVAASEDQLTSVEASLGHEIDAQYRSFLSRANGWKGFYQRVDLFGTAELTGGAHMDKSLSLLESLEPIVPLCGVQRSELLPIAVSHTDIDLFVIGRPSSPLARKVLWLAGGLIDTFQNFGEYFLAMVDYNRREVKRLQIDRS